MLARTLMPAALISVSFGIWVCTMNDLPAVRDRVRNNTRAGIIPPCFEAQLPVNFSNAQMLREAHQSSDLLMLLSLAPTVKLAPEC